MMSLNYQLFLILLSFRGLESLEVDVSVVASKQPKHTSQMYQSLGETPKDEELLPLKPSNSFQDGYYKQRKNSKPGESK